MPMSKKSQDTRRVPEVNSTSDPGTTEDKPLCGACGQHHTEGRGICDLDPMTFIPDIAASDDERKVRGALYALNNAIDPDDSTIFGQMRNHRLEEIRAQLWAMGQELYRWKD